MYQRVGGEEFFETLTQRFYAGVGADPVLAPLYPDTEQEYEEARLHLKWFLIQYWGGPPVYDERRGAPRLRMRHAPFRIGIAERDAWFEHMSAAVAAAELRPLDATQMMGYFATAANAMVNVG